MAKNKYYYFDEESCQFVEADPAKKRLYTNGALVFALSLLMTGVIVWAIDAHLIGTPQEIALQAENEALQAQMESVESRIQDFSEELENFSSTDRELYRTLFQAEPISDDVMQVGIGGADAYEEFDRFGGSTAQLLRNTAESIDELERRFDLQGESFRMLTDLAENYQEELAQLPALLPTEGPIVSGFGVRRHPILGVNRMHAGIDVLVEEGTPIVAPGDGRVKEVGQNAGYGIYVKLDHPSIEYRTLYAHLSEVPSGIRVGAEVERGDVIAYSGNTGRSTGPHLHYEVRDTDGNAVNPIHFFAPNMSPREYERLLLEAERSQVSLD